MQILFEKKAKDLCQPPINYTLPECIEQTRIGREQWQRQGEANKNHLHLVSAPAESPEARACKVGLFGSLPLGQIYKSAGPHSGGATKLRGCFAFPKS